MGAGAALVIGVGAQPVSATALWTVNFTGHGTSQSDATLTSDGVCPTTDHSTVKSAFHWSVTWEHVALSTPAVTGNIIGSLLGTAYETDKITAPADCGGDKNCDETEDFSADEGLDGSNPAALFFYKETHSDDLFLDLLVFSDSEAKCESEDPDDTGFLVANPAGGDVPQTTDPLAASVGGIVPSWLKHDRKIILNVQKGLDNYPTAGDEDCSDSSLGIKCSQSQDWSGTITMLRTA